MKRIAIYARVSTAHHTQDPDTQLLPLRDYAAQRGFVIVDEYVDRGWSGTKEKRPNLDRLMADARKHRFDLILVARFDRFARSVRHLLAALFEFQQLGIDFASLSEAIDTSTPMGRMIFTVLGAVAELERELIRERVLMGVARAKRQGKTLGRPRALVDEQQVCELVASGRSIQSVAKTSGISRQTVRRLIAKRGQKAEIGGCPNPVSEGQPTH